MDNSYSEQPTAQQSQEATEPSLSPAPQSPYYPEPPYSPNAAYSGDSGDQSIPLPRNAPSSGYQPDGQKPHDALPPYAGYQAPEEQQKRLNVFEQFIADAKLVLMRPSVASFDAIQSHSNMSMVLLGLLIVGGAYAAAGSIINPAAGVSGGLGGTFLGFFISIGVATLVAKAFGGVGNFKTYAYVIAVFDVPLGIVDAVSILVPVVTGLIFLLGLGYGIYLGVLATSSVHRLSTGKSVAVYLISLAMKLAIPLCVFGAVAAVMLYSLFGHQ
jgi:Yip1-like protein